MKKKDYIFENIKILKGVGKNTARYLRNKKIETIRDLLLEFPYFLRSLRERSPLQKDHQCM